MVRTYLIVVALTALAVGGCGMAPEGSVIDGWSIGDHQDCRLNVHCDEFMTAAVSALDRRDPGHPAIADAKLYRQGKPGAPMVCSTGCRDVAVFQLVDGSLRAIGVKFLLGSPPGEPSTEDYGPGLNR